MGTISSSIGLVSGLDYNELIRNLLALDARPITLLQNRIAKIDAQKTTFLDISARMNGLIAGLNSLATPSFFQSKSVSSSQPTVATATVGSTTPVGNYSFFVRSLAATQQLISRGYSSASAKLAPGTLTIESNDARVNQKTRLSELNGYRGVQSGSFKLTDATGAEATIGVGSGDSVADVLARINSAGLNVRAQVRNDQLVLSETSGGALRITEVAGGKTAADLGFGIGKTYSATGGLTGDNLIYLAGATPIAALNDGLGLRRAVAGGDFTLNNFTVDLSDLLSDPVRLERLNGGAGVERGVIRITTQDAAGSQISTDVDLSAAKTIGDVSDAIERAVPGLIVTPTSSRLVVSYLDGSTNKTLNIADVTGTAAADLGIADEESDSKIDGANILQVQSLSDVIAAINFAAGNDGSVVATLAGDHIEISAGGEDVTVAAINGSRALADLGLQDFSYRDPAVGRRILAGIDTVLLETLNGGAGVSGGVLQLEFAGNTSTIDLSGATTLQQVIDAINDDAKARGLALEAGYDANGTRVVVSSLDGTTPITISDLSGTLGAQLGLVGSGPTLKGANVQRQYIAENTAIAALNDGRGLTLGAIQLTDSLGRVATVNLNDGTVKTLADVISKLNAAGVGVKASINSTGDGLLIEDTAGGAGSLKIKDESGASAIGLNIAGEFAGKLANGSYERNFAVSSATTLQQLVDQINATSAGATASILNDGSANGYRLQLTSRTSGLNGELLVDGGALGLDLTTLSRAQDAEIVLGSDPNTGLVVRSATNSFTNLAPGLSVTVTGVSQDAVALNVTAKNDAVYSTLDSLVSGFNDLIDRISSVSGYNVETEQAGILLGDSVLQTTESRLFRAFTLSSTGLGGLVQRLSDVGITLKDGHLEFDHAKLDALLESNPAQVEQLFSDVESGLAIQIRDILESAAGEAGLIEQRNETLDDQRTLLTERIAALNERLAAKRERLTRQFLALEQTLAELQGQQSALAGLSALSLTPLSS